jgi:transposase
MSPAQLVFVDETGAATNMARRYGRSPRGRRLDGPIPHGHWKSTTFVGGLTTRGFIAPYVLDGPMNGAVFKAWVEQMLAPALRPGDIVIMDNLPAHKIDGIEQAIRDRQAELCYLPPYSPDLNPSGAARPIRSRRDRRLAAAEASRPSPSSRHSCAKPPSAPKTACGTPSAGSSTCSPRPNAPTTLPTPAMHGQHENALVS